MCENEKLSRNAMVILGNSNKGDRGTIWFTWMDVVFAWQSVVRDSRGKKKAFVVGKCRNY